MFCSQWLCLEELQRQERKKPVSTVIRPSAQRRQEEGRHRARGRERRLWKQRVSDGIQAVPPLTLRKISATPQSPRASVSPLENVNNTSTYHTGILGSLSQTLLMVCSKHPVQSPAEKLLSETSLLAATPAVRISRKCFSLRMCI